MSEPVCHAGGDEKQMIGDAMRLISRACFFQPAGPAKCAEEAAIAMNVAAILLSMRGFNAMRADLSWRGMHVFVIILEMTKAGVVEKRIEDEVIYRVEFADLYKASKTILHPRDALLGLMLLVFTSN